MHSEYKKPKLRKRLEDLSKPKSDEDKSIDDMLKDYTSRMHKVEIRKEKEISRRLKNTTCHLEKVNEIKNHHHSNAFSHDFDLKSPQIRSLTQKYKRMEQIEKNKKAKIDILKQKREEKEHRAYINLLNKQQEENERKRYLRQKLKEKENSGYFWLIV